MQYAQVKGKLVKATKGSVGFDLFATEDLLVPPQTHAVVPTGVFSEMEGCFAVLFDRSGLAAKFGVGRMAGLIDTDYAGEWKVVLANYCGREAYQVKAGDRIAQAVFFDHQKCWDRIWGAEVNQTQEERTGGFGSTGTN